MSMSRSEWARRVAAIGQMAGWSARKIAQFSEPRQITFLLFDRMVYDLYVPEPERVIAAVRQLCAAWLAAEGVVADRWRTGTPEREGEYWVEYRGLGFVPTGEIREKLIYDHGGWYDGKWRISRGLTVLRWQELPGLDYEVPRG